MPPSHAPHATPDHDPGAGRLAVRAIRAREVWRCDLCGTLRNGLDRDADGRVWCGSEAHAPRRMVLAGELWAADHEDLAFSRGG